MGASGVSFVLSSQPLEISVELGVLRVQISEVSQPQVVVALFWIMRLKPYALPGGGNHIMNKHIALGLLAGTLFSAGCCSTHHEHAAAKWEYQQLHVGQTDASLNKLADEGWVVDFCGINNSGEPWYVLRREKK